jgi:hypothetical protein
MKASHMTPEDNNKFDAILGISQLLDKMAAKLFAKLAYVPLEAIEKELLLMEKKFRDDGDPLCGKHLEMLSQRIELLHCLARFRDDLIQNVPDAKKCYDEMKDIRELLTILDPDKIHSIKTFRLDI